MARFLALLRARGLMLRVVDAASPPVGLRQRWRSVCHVPAGSVPAEAMELHSMRWTRARCGSGAAPGPRRGQPDRSARNVHGKYSPCPTPCDPA
ncbi:MAG: hypothetical protein JO157_03830 [Acetobacteraceae bacterium]|nr:hypothetical protein [Acetobacteraceae bacterium]